MTEPYRVMARRWRPQTFQEVVGQEAVVRTLQNAIAQRRLAHALLFAGPRGVGKTSTARLLAKALNCVQGPTPDPCGACQSCRDVAEGRQPNVLEIDGASHNRVEEARDLIETVQYAPGPGRWRMVIVDEVHMLSTAAFNALLKTIEEPPPNVVFVLATTEPHKVPATIQSRCQRHDFRRLAPQEIAASLADRLRRDGGPEGGAASPEVLGAIARAAQGSLRDAQTLLEQVLAYGGPGASLQDVEDCLGLVRADRLVEAADAILSRAVARGLELVDGLHRQGHDLRLFCQELAGHFRDLAVAKVCAAPEKLLATSRVPAEALRQQAQRVDLPQIELILKALLEAEGEMRRSGAPRLALEMALIRTSELRHLEPVPRLIARLQELEQRLGAAPAAVSPAPADLPLFAAVPAPLAPVAPPARATATATPAPPRPTSPEAAIQEAPRASSAPAPAAPTDAAAGWERARRLLASRKRLAAVLAESEAALQGEILEVTVPNGSGFVKDVLEDTEARRLVAEAVREAFGERLQVRYQYRAPRGSTRGGRPIGASAPEARPALADQPAVRLALDLFEGRIAGSREDTGGAR